MSGVMMTSDRAAELAVRFDCLSHSARVRILAALQSAPMIAGELSALLGVRQQAATHHLTILRLKGLVEFRRSGRTNGYLLTEAGRTAVRLIEAA